MTTAEKQTIVTICSRLDKVIDSLVIPVSAAAELLGVYNGLKKALNDIQNTEPAALPLELVKEAK